MGRDRIERWLVDQLADLVGVEPHAIDPTGPFAGFGLDSAQGVGLVGDLEVWLDRTLAPTVLFEHPSPRALAAHLAADAEPVAALDEFRRPAPSAAEPIAIVGLASRLPGADDVQAFWQRLLEGFDAISPLPEARRVDAASALPPPLGGWLERIDGFDRDYFRMSSREVVLMDPQQRLALEVAGEALEDAGLLRDDLPGDCGGVFLGISNFDYPVLHSRLCLPSDPWTTVGSAHSMAANRISYVLGLRGPSLAVDTACSSSLVAVHLACESLLRGECDFALAGGVNLLVCPEITQSFAQAGFLAADGRCKSFDARADGYVRGEGCGLVVLKPLSRARADGDTVHAVVLGSAVNNDGPRNGLTAPNPASQAQVLRAAYRRAGVEAGSVQYVEAHGTGTQLGDPIEVEALQAVLGEGRDPDRPCVIGSVKSNIGHLESAAGAAALIKTVLALRHRTIPMNLHFETPNRRIPFDSLGLRVAREHTPWPRGDVPRRAGVSSFGFGGTNAHVVLEEAPAEAPRPAAIPDGVPHLLPLSARCPAALRESARRHAEILARPDLDPARLRDHCATAALRRAHHPHRLVALGDDAPALARQLAAFAAGEPPPELAHGLAPPQRGRRLAFVFSGQGAQEPGMGRTLDSHETAFRQVLDRCDRLYRDRTGDGLREILFAPPERSRLACTEVAQPALFALQVALAAQWQAWGVRPDAVVGHSLGEIAAAHVAGILPLEDAFDLVLERARRIEAAAHDDAPGRMLAVDLAPDDACAWIDRAGVAPHVALAATNAPAAVVLAGDRAPLETLARDLEAARVAVRWIPVDYAFHTPRMDPAAEGLRTVLADLRPRDGTLPFFSTVTGECLPGTALDADYWARNVREPVRFAPALAALAAEGFDTFLELGAHPVLRLALDQTLRAAGLDAPRLLPSLRRGRDERRTLRQTLAGLHAAGVGVDWNALHAETAPTRVVSLPAYPWQRQRHWIPTSPHASAPAPLRHLHHPDGSTRTAHPLLSHYVEIGSPPARVWETRLSRERVPYLEDHRVEGTVVVPGAAYVELAAAVAEELSPDAGVCIEGLELERPLVLPEGQERVLQATLCGDAEKRIEVASRAEPDQPWTRHATATLRRTDAPPPPEGLHPEALFTRCPEPVDVEGFYRMLAEAGLDYGPSFRCVRELRRSPGEAVARLALDPKDAPAAGAYGLHPALLDAAFQVAGAAAADHLGGGLFLPSGCERVVRHARVGAACFVQARLAHADVGSVRCDLQLLGETGSVIAQVESFVLTRLREDSPAATANAWFHEIRFQKAPLEPGEPPDRAPATWVVLRDDHGLGDALCEALRQRGDRCLTVSPGDRFATLPGDRFTVRPTDPADVAALLRHAFGNGHPACRGVLHLWTLDAPGFDATQASALREGSERGILAALALVQALVRAGLRDAPTLWIVTRGAQALRPDEAPAVAQAPLWGLGRTLAHEHPELEARRADLDPRADLADAATALLAELDAGSREPEVAWRDGRRFVPRLVRRAPDAPPATRCCPDPEASFRLEVTRPGTFDRLLLREVPRRFPDPGEVEIRVRSAGLNFKDVLIALGVVPGGVTETVPLGMECAGEVVATGEGVDDLAPGDPVVALSPSALSRFVTIQRRFVMRRPEGVDFDRAATLPVAFLTAHYALSHLARLEPGERVLIHAATGGVGQAALQIARHRGAEIHATAGSEAKRAWLREQGVEHVYESRSLDFAEQILTATRGRGVDVVLNSLTGPAIEKGLEVLAPGGRFVEIGIRDLLENHPLGLRPFLKGLAYFTVDLSRLLLERPDRLARLLDEVRGHLEAGDWTPLPCQRFDIERAAEAFRHMAAARHLGKLVISFPDRPAELAAPCPPVRPGAAYLVTGGLGALGLAIAGWLVEQGARHLVLVGRRAPSPAARDAVAALERLGARIRVRAADVTDAAAVAQLVADLEVPLRGVVHAAGVLDDGVALELDRDRVERVMAPKVLGAWHIHEATRDRPLDFLLFFSSVASILGSPGQASYTAANAFLDALAHARRARGLAAQSLDWGPWAGIGMAAGRTFLGIASLPPDRATACLGRVLADGAPQLGIFQLDLGQWAEMFPAQADLPLLDELVDGERRAGPRDGTAAPMRRRLLEEASAAERLRLLEQHLREQMASVLGIDPSEVRSDRSFSEMGFDSLMAVELRNRVRASLGVAISTTLLFGFPTLRELAPEIARQIGTAGDVPAAEATGHQAQGRERIREVAELSEDDAHELLLTELARVGGEAAP